jgi:enterochelin esterase-like enzyme
MTIVDNHGYQLGISIQRAPVATGAYTIMTPGGTAMTSATTYTLGPDSQRKPDVPRGEVIQFQHVSKIYPEARRDYWVYVPQQLDPSIPAAVMVFQDGHAYVSEDGNCWKLTDDPEMRAICGLSSG